uniref:Uncharacterized protein n=1 Tax=Anguilla anguilla TaxID=7936 RepID=A0A0E9SAE0_ANGAN
MFRFSLGALVFRYHRHCGLKMILIT